MPHCESRAGQTPSPDRGRLPAGLVANECVMPQAPCKEIAECHQQASEARQRAVRAHDPELIRDFLDLERLWLVLARSYELSDRQASFTDVRPGGNKYSR